MPAMTDMLTPTEAAAVAAVSMREVDQLLEERVLPEKLYTTGATRSVLGVACTFIAFYAESANRLTAEERQRVIAIASDSSFDWEASDRWVRDEFLTIDFGVFYDRVAETLKQLNMAREMVVSDPGILSGTPVIKGSRVPAYDIAASVVQGIPMEEILEAYPSIDRKQVELAALYARAYPLQVRPLEKRVYPPGTRFLYSGPLVRLKQA